MTQKDTNLGNALEAFYHEVYAHRHNCNTAWAREINMRLTNTLHMMYQDHCNIVDAAEWFIKAIGTREEERANLEIQRHRHRWHENWLDGPIPLLDSYRFDPSTNEYTDRRTGRTYTLAPDAAPIVVPVKAAQLCGLADIIVRVEETAGVRFSIDHVYYSEADAEAAGWKRAGLEPNVPPAK